MCNLVDDNIGNNCEFILNFEPSLKDVFNNSGGHFVQFLFVCFVALRPRSTAMVIAGRSVHLTTLFPGQA